MTPTTVDPIAVIHRWWQIREASEYEGRITNAQTFLLEADHSMRGGLLERLMDGKEPLRHPPPCKLSRPWYGLIDAGEGHAMEVWSLPALRGQQEPKVGDPVVVDQHDGWSLVAIHDVDDWSISYPHWGTWRATRLETETMAWKLVREP
jgi:hypothetical protein